MKPVALTMGDPCGIGPELIAKCFADADWMAGHPAVVVGDPDVLREAALRWAPGLAVRAVEHVIPAAPGVMPVVASSRLTPRPPPGQVNAEAGRAAARAVERAVALVQAGEAAGLCTAPLNKAALAAAGLPFPGHTEMLAALAGGPEVGMVLATPQLKTILVSVHCALREAIARLTSEAVLRTIRLAHRTLRAWGVAAPRIAVAGLNPHAGEDGLFGHEDMALIAPAVRQARVEGLDASGPHPPDTVFMRARRGDYDIVVAQYHDQGLIPVKLLGIEEGVNITAGLPFVRTSPDHGTAFDIAGRGLADPASLKAALAMAHRLAASRKEA